MRSPCPAALLGLLFLGLGASACRGTVSWLPAAGHAGAARKDQVRLPGLAYLALGQGRQEALGAMRAHGFDCSEEASSGRTQACVRPPGKEEPTGGVAVLEFEGNALAGVQAQLQPEGDETGRLALSRFRDLEQEWTRAFGPAQEIRRPGITATRRSLRDGTALLAVCYDGEPTLIVEHVQMQFEGTRLPVAMREAGSR